MPDSRLFGMAFDAVQRSRLRGDVVILLKRIKIGNPAGFQTIEIQNVRIP